MAVEVAGGEEQDRLVTDEAGMTGDEVEGIGWTGQVGELGLFSSLHVEGHDLGGFLSVRSSPPISVRHPPPIGAEAEGDPPLHTQAVETGADEEVGFVAGRSDPLRRLGAIRAHEEEPLLGELWSEAAELRTDDPSVRHLE